MVDKQIVIDAFDINAVSSIVKRLDINIISVLSHYLKGAYITYNESDDEASINIHKVRSQSEKQSERNTTIVLSISKKKLATNSKSRATNLYDEQYIKSIVNKEDADTYRRIFDIYFLYNYLWYLYRYNRIAGRNNSKLNKAIEDLIKTLTDNKYISKTDNVIDNDKVFRSYIKDLKKSLNKIDKLVSKNIVDDIDSYKKILYSIKGILDSYNSSKNGFKGKLASIAFRHRSESKDLELLDIIEINLGNISNIESIIYSKANDYSIRDVADKEYIEEDNIYEKDAAWIRVAKAIAAFNRAEFIIKSIRSDEDKADVTASYFILMHLIDIEDKLNYGVSFREISPFSIEDLFILTFGILHNSEFSNFKKEYLYGSIKYLFEYGSELIKLDIDERKYFMKRLLAKYLTGSASPTT
ncbi:MAG: hypothetical protein ARM1_0571 [Candidatus Micrarchaeota archaeon]|nr:MAG: hypothetical protein ARM1_0571 [Candidatus Micrarchaeota archaeon]